MFMERNSIFPEITVAPRLQRLQDYVMRKLCIYPDGAPDYMSEHYEPAETGAEAMFSTIAADSRRAANQPKLPFPDRQPDAGFEDGGRWGSLGEY
jgi:hypothetical protein